MNNFRNYYHILNVGQYASKHDIRRSFRKLAKKYHPDTTSLEAGLAQAHMRILLEAYRILMDETKREAYNLRFRARLRKRGQSYAEHLQNREQDPYSQALLVLYRLIEGKYIEAIQIYEHLDSLLDGNYKKLRELLGFGDYLDFTFLLAEALEKIGDYLQAAKLYEEAYHYDLKWNYFRLFRSEVRHRIRSIYCHHLARIADPKTSIHYYVRLLENYCFPKNERAFFMKKIAERYCQLENSKKAQTYLEQAMALHPGLVGTKKLRSQLRILSQLPNQVQTSSKEQ